MAAPARVREFHNHRLPLWSSCENHHHEGTPILREDFTILRLATMNENGLCGAGQGSVEGRGFSPAVRALTHHFVVPPLPRAGEGQGERELPAAAGLKPRPSAAIFMEAKDLCSGSSLPEA